VGQYRRKKAVARLHYAALVLAASLGTRAANADECACVSVPPQPSQAAAQQRPTPSDAQKPKRLAGGFSKRTGNFDLHLVGSDANSETNPEALKAGETSRKYVGIELGGKLGSVMQTQAQVRFTEAQSDPEKAMFDLQPVSQNGDARRALQDFSTASSFFSERLTVSSYQRNSSFALIDATGENTKGQLQQHHVVASLWRSDRADFDFDAALSRTSSNYWDFGDSPDADLHANNSQISQYRSKVRFDRFGLSVFHRDTATLSGANVSEIGPRRSETEARVSLNLADWRDSFGMVGEQGWLLPLPDSIWVGTNTGAFAANDPSAMLRQTVNKLSLGASRSFPFGTVNASYWRSVTEPVLGISAGYRGAGHGVDLGSNLHFGAWGLTGNVTFANNQTFFVGSDSQLDTLRCAFFVTWKAPLRVDIKAGVTTNALENQFADDDRLERNNSFRYQLVLDLSQLASSSLAQRNVQLKLLASFDGNQTRSQSDYVNATGDIFTGLQFAVPLHP
jgi:hypothetical protein